MTDHPEGTLFRHVSVFDGTGAPGFLADVSVRGRHIEHVRPHGAGGPALAAPPGWRCVDGRGATLLPGLVESHAHLTFPSSVGRPIARPPEEAVLAHVTARNARILLESGYTSAFSAGARSPRVEVALRDEIDGGWLPGPRLRACSVERGAAGIGGALG
ncbi:MAG: hypothetical protein QM586_09360, partial [Xenophilus sp.]